MSEAASLPDAPLYTHPLFQKLTGSAWRPGGLELTRHGLALCGFAPGMRVADVGCGAGATLAVLHAHGLRALGLDIAPRPAACPVVCAHAAHLPLAAQALDGLLCECVLSLLQDTKAVLSGFARVLRPGGALLLSDLFVHTATPAPLRVAHRSCLDGAMPRQALEQALEHCGFHMECFEDHTALLRPLAAQLLWHGLSCGEPSPGQSPQRWGYGLWIARKRPTS